MYVQVKLLILVLLLITSIVICMVLMSLKCVHTAWCCHCILGALSDFQGHRIELLQLVDFHRSAIYTALQHLGGVAMKDVNVYA